MDLTALPLLPFWKTSSQKIPFTTPSRPLTLIYAGSCFTVSKTVVGLRECASPKVIWAYLRVTHLQTQHTAAAEKFYLNVSWLFCFVKAWITVKPVECAAPCTKCLAPSHGKHSAHFMHFISPPFPSAVPLIFHIRLLIITASRTICFWTNLPPFQINISRQVKWHLSSLSIEACEFITSQ